MHFWSYISFRNFMFSCELSVEFSSLRMMLEGTCLGQTKDCFRKDLVMPSYVQGKLFSHWSSCISRESNCACMAILSISLRNLSWAVPLPSVKWGILMTA